MAVQHVSTYRRGQGKHRQELRVSEALTTYGFTPAARRRIRTALDAPEVGSFCPESLLGNRKADFVARLWDGRIMPIECKVSNSAVNSVKRLNNDAAAKAEAWRADFGNTQVLPVAVLSGVYKLHNLEDAQRRGLTLFWAHRLEDMVRWIDRTRN